MSLHEYLDWRRSLIHHPVGTRFLWIEERKGLYVGDLIRAGSYFELESITVPAKGGRVECPADNVYNLIQITKTGKRYKRVINYFCEGIHKYIKEGKVVVVPTE